MPMLLPFHSLGLSLPFRSPVVFRYSLLKTCIIIGNSLKMLHESMAISASVAVICGRMGVGPGTNLESKIAQIHSRKNMPLIESPSSVDKREGILP